MIEKDEVLSGLWTPPASRSGLKTSSNRWSESLKQITNEEFKVAYEGGLVTVKKHSTYYIDAKNRILVGWHRTYNPPSNMEGNSMI